MAAKHILQLSTCLVQAYHSGNIESLAKAANNPRIARWMQNTFPQPYTVKDAENWISIANTRSPLLDFAICQPDGITVIGGVGLKAQEDVHHRTMEIGYWMAEDYWHQGIATEVIAKFSSWAFDNFANLVRLEAEVFEGNTASCRVLEKCGFEFEGRQKAAVEKLGVIMDAYTYVKLRVEE
ncbi:acyl-CoA N-acyltransferase [Fusarium tricinctum]|uniref:Acyl-CoA N-acyltransferase n=1 Tax=Fusarium tricinctum TaxID=61284 RepID=A0A8K0RMF0_9HYPO|nr:acyl-CoA N-acyltransferase [Fusarium tricinctum]